MSYSNFFTGNDFQIQVVAHGTTTDCLEYPDPRTYEVNTWVIRLNHIALSQWHASKPISLEKWDEEFTTLSEAVAERVSRSARRKKWEQEIRKRLQLTDVPGTVSITQNIAECFTVISIRRI